MHVCSLRIGDTPTVLHVTCHKLRVARGHRKPPSGSPYVRSHTRIYPLLLLLSLTLLRVTGSSRTWRKDRAISAQKTASILCQFVIGPRFNFRRHKASFLCYNYEPIFHKTKWRWDFNKTDFKLQSQHL